MATNNNDFSILLNENINKIKVCADPVQTGNNWLFSVQVFGENGKKSAAFGKETTNCGEFTLSAGDCFTSMKVFFDREVEYMQAQSKNNRRFLVRAPV